MNLPINDIRSLSVALLDPSTGEFFDPNTGQMGAFDPKMHLKVAAPIKVTPASGVAVPATLFAGLKTAYDGNALMSNPNLVPVWFQLDASGNPTAVADIWPNPFPAQWPIVSGGWSRS